MPPGVDGTDRSVVDLELLVPQELLAFTLKVPELKTAGSVNCIIRVPCPLTIDEPAGMVQL